MFYLDLAVYFCDRLDPRLQSVPFLEASLQFLQGNAFSVGHDGTSIHYGNGQGEMHTAPEIVNVLTEACHTLSARHHVGGNGTCEALYRITPAMADGFRRRGCLSASCRR